MFVEDEEILHEIAMDMEPEDGRIYVMDVDDEESIVAFTPFGIENLKESLADRKREWGCLHQPSLWKRLLARTRILTPLSVMSESCDLRHRRFGTPRSSYGEQVHYPSLPGHRPLKVGHELPGGVHTA
jgi:hypothetical protein